VASGDDAETGAGCAGESGSGLAEFHPLHVGAITGASRAAVASRTGTNR